MAQQFIEPKKLLGQKVLVYWNSTVCCYSLKLKGKVVQHATALLLTQADTKVSQPGYDRVKRTGHKTVYATMVGQLSMIDIKRPYGETGNPVVDWPQFAWHLGLRFVDGSVTAIARLSKNRPSFEYLRADLKKWSAFSKASIVVMVSDQTRPRVLVVDPS